jgi:hypothetical protein
VDSPEVKERKAQLQLFLQKAILNMEICTSADLKSFLQDKDKKFTAESFL